MNNETRSKILPVYKEDEIDTHPLWLKKLLWDAPIYLIVQKDWRKLEPERAKMELEKHYSALALEAYGADHPAARAAVEAQRELGF